MGENVTLYQNETFGYEELVAELVKVEHNGVEKLEKDKEKVEEEMTKVTKLSSTSRSFLRVS